MSASYKQRLFFYWELLCFYCGGRRCFISGLLVIAGYSHDRLPSAFANSGSLCGKHTWEMCKLMASGLQVCISDSQVLLYQPVAHGSEGWNQTTTGGSTFAFYPLPVGVKTLFIPLGLKMIANCLHDRRDELSAVAIQRNRRGLRGSAIVKTPTGLFFHGEKEQRRRACGLRRLYGKSSRRHFSVTANNSPLPDEKAGLRENDVQATSISFAVTGAAVSANCAFTLATMFSTDKPYFLRSSSCVEACSMN